MALTAREYEDIVKDVNTARPHLLQTNTHETDAAFLYHCCVAINAADPSREVGLLSKEAGENGYTWPNGVRTSHDAICFRNNGQRFDIIGSAGNGQPASPAWQGPQPERPHNVFLPLSAVPAPDGAAPGPAPTPGLALWEPPHAALLARWPLAITRSQATMRKIAEQFAFSFPSEGWGVKHADPNRPQSDNVIARKIGNALIGYQLVPAVSAPPPINLQGQHFVAVTPINHLGLPNPGPSPTPTPTPNPQPSPGGDVPYPGNEEAVFDRVGETLFADFSAHGQAPNPGMFRWAARVCWTASNSIKQGVSPVAAIQAAIAKHRPEWVAILKGA